MLTDGEFKSDGDVYLVYQTRDDMVIPVPTECCRRYVPMIISAAGSTMHTRERRPKGAALLPAHGSDTPWPDGGGGLKLAVASNLDPARAGHEKWADEVLCPVKRHVRYRSAINSARTSWVKQRRFVIASQVAAAPFRETGNGFTSSSASLEFAGERQHAGLNPRAGESERRRATVAKEGESGSDITRSGHRSIKGRMRKADRRSIRGVPRASLDQRPTKDRTTPRIVTRVPPFWGKDPAVPRLREFGMSRYAMHLGFGRKPRRTPRRRTVQVSGPGLEREGKFAKPERQARIQEPWPDGEHDVDTNALSTAIARQWKEQPASGKRERTRDNFAPGRASPSSGIIGCARRTPRRQRRGQGVGGSSGVSR